MRKDLEPSTAKTSDVASSECHSTVFGTGGEAQPSRKLFPKLAVKRKADELSGLDGSAVPFARRPVPVPLSADGSVALGATGESAAGGSRQLRPTESGHAYAAVEAVRIKTLQPGGPLKPAANCSDTSESAASSETADRPCLLKRCPGLCMAC
jgi:hypothetical protein